ncbi:MAG: hypothetical protein ABIZ81_03925 [Opitutaceae bacterium]
MNEPRVRELFIEHHHGALPPAEAAELRAFLAAHPALQREFDEFASTLDALDAMPIPPPSSRLRAQVLAAIDAEKRATRRNFPAVSEVMPPRSIVAPRRLPWIWLVRITTACALLAVGYFVGTRKPAETVVASDATLAAGERVSQRELADLRRQVEAMNRLVSDSLLPQPLRPTNERLKTVLASASVENPNDRIINELIGSLALDPSANVRLTALEALYPHADLEVVRAGVLSSLPREQSPLVQVAMIDFLTAARDRAAAPALDRISRSDTMDRNVRAAAMRALNQL